jgi:hypothetical protein
MQNNSEKLDLIYEMMHVPDPEKSQQAGYSGEDDTYILIYTSPLRVHVFGRFTELLEFSYGKPERGQIYQVSGQAFKHSPTGRQIRLDPWYIGYAKSGSFHRQAEKASVYSPEADYGQIHKHLNTRFRPAPGHPKLKSPEELAKLSQGGGIGT